MVARADILAGRAVILINIQDTIEKQLRSIRGKMRMFANSMSEIGSDLFRGGLAGTAASIFPVAEFMNFQDQLLFLQTKLQATDQKMKPLEKTIRQLGMSTSFSSKEVGQAATMYAQAGFSLAEVQASLQAALDLARGGQVDLSTSTTILSNALRTFQKDASNAASFASKFITAARLGTLDIVDLGESLKYSSGTFANFGVSIEEVLGLITTLANSGLKASLAGTSLNTAFLNMASNAPDLRALLGVELLEEDFKNPLQALKKLEAGLQKFSKVEQSGILQQLVNIRGGRAIQGLLLQGLDKVEANIKAVTESQDEARRSAAKLDSQLGGVWRRGVSAFQELAIAIGATSEGPLTKFGESLAAILNNLSRLTGENQRFAQTMLLLGPAALVAGVGLLTITMLLSKVAMLLTPLMMLNSVLFSIGAAVVGGNMKMIGGISAEITKASIAASKFTGPSFNLGPALVKGLNSVTSLAPKIATKAGALFALSFATIMQSKFAAYAKWMFSPLMSVLPVIHSIGRAITSTLLLAGGVVTPRSFMDIARAVHMIVKNAAKIKLSFLDVFAGAQLIAGQTFVMANNLRLIAQMKIGDSFRALKNLPQTFSGASMMGVFTSKIAEAFVQGVAKGLIAAGKIIKNSPTLTGITQLGNAMFGKQFGSRLNIGIGKQLSVAFRNLAKGGLVKTIGNLFSSLFSGLGKGLKAVFSVNYLKTFLTGMKSLWSVARGLFGVLNGIRRMVFITSGWLAIVEFLIIFGDKIPVIKDMLAGLGAAFANLFGNVKGIFADISEQFKFITFGFQQMFAGNLEGGLITLSNAFKNMGAMIRDGLIHAWQKFMFDIKPGADAIREIITGLMATFEALGAAIGGIFGTVMKGGEIMVKADGSLLDLVKSLFSPENLQALFAAVVGFIGSIGSGIIQAVGTISNVLIEIKNVFAAILTGIANLPIFGGAAKEAAESINEPTGEGSERAKELLKQIKADEEYLDRYVSRITMSQRDKEILRKDIQRKRDEVAKLGFDPGTGANSTPLVDVGAQQAALQARIDEILTGMQNAATSITDPGKSRQEAIAAAEEAEFGGALSDIIEDFDVEGEVSGLGTAIEGVTADLEAQRKSLLDDLVTARVPNAVEPEMAAQLESVTAGIGKAIVGDFQSSRGNMLQMVPKMEQLQERANKLLEDGNDIGENIAASLKKSGVFA